MSTGGINRAGPAAGAPISASSPQSAAEPRASPGPGQAQGAASPAFARKVAKAINSSPELGRVEAKVYKDEASDKYVLAIFSRSSGQLIRQYPPGGIIQLASKLKAGTLGSLLDELA